MAIQNVRGHVAGTHKVEEAHQGNGGVADVHHHLLLRGISDLTRHFQGRNGVGFPGRPMVNAHFEGIRLRRDSFASVRYSKGLNSGKSSATLRRTDRHGSMGQKSSDFQVFL